MKTIKSLLLTLLAAFTLTACNDYLDIKPENSIATEDMWKSKSDVESALFSGYYNLRASITTHLIPLGELRAGYIKSRSTTALEQFEVKSTTSTITDWNAFYKIIADANGVIANAEKARANDATYTIEEMNSHLTEAYFLRALGYFYVVRNWRDAPLVLEPMETDDANLYPAQTSEDSIIAQIKTDLYTAIELNAAKTAFDTTWETKGRATIWAIYALMADVCLFNSDFDEAITYADLILESSSPYAPRFMSTPTHSSWFKIFNPGNSDESIFELQYSAQYTEGTSYQTNSLPTIFGIDNTTTYLISSALALELNREATSILAYHEDDQDAFVRTRYGSFYGAENSSLAYVWKYRGGTTITEPRSTDYYDPNFIIYRVSEMMMIKAEALVMRDGGQNNADNEEAIALVNQLRTRTNLDETTVTASSGLTEILTAIVQERREEFLAEGKGWYDLLRVGHYKYKNDYGVDFVKDIFIPIVQTYNEAATSSRIQSTLLQDDAWYLPVNEDEMTHNPSLVQNKYYD